MFLRKAQASGLPRAGGKAILNQDSKWTPGHSQTRLKTGWNASRGGHNTLPFIDYIAVLVCPPGKLVVSCQQALPKLCGKPPWLSLRPRGSFTSVFGVCSRGSRQSDAEVSRWRGTGGMGDGAFLPHSPWHRLDNCILREVRIRLECIGPYSEFPSIINTH